MTNSSPLTPLKVNEIFYSLQGEGRFTGTAAIFLRLSGCNLSCPFCDTDHQNGSPMTIDDILKEITQYPSRHLVITGGEPALQLTPEHINRFHSQGYFVQIETNGTVNPPDNIDWVTCSPKTSEINCDNIDELKLIFMGNETDDKRISHFENLNIRHKYLQPCDHSQESTLSEPHASTTHTAQLNRQTVEKCIEYIKHHPRWRLSLQTHKLLAIP